MKAWYQTLHSREQLLINVAIILVLMLILFIGLIEPMSTEKQRLSVRLESQSQLLHKLKSMEAEVMRYKAHEGSETATESSEQSLLSILDSSSNQFKVKQNISRLTPESEEKARLWLEDVDFDSSLSWLIELSQAHNINVEAISFSRKDKNGVVNASMTLSR